MSVERTGKPSPTRLKELLGGHFGAVSEHTLLGPGPGLDAAVLDLGDGRVLAVAEDPIFPAPGLPLEIMGWFTVHIGASDVAVTGVPPQFMTYSLLLPPSCPESDAKRIIVSVSEAARDLGIAIVGGHTGWYGAVTVPMVGGVTVWGIAERSAWVSPGGARDGDVILMTKGPAVEASALLAILYRDRIAKRAGRDSVERAIARVHQITVVEDARTAFASGGVHAMHDATEGGVLGGLFEMSSAAGVAASVDLDRVEVPSDIRDVAGALGFDPWCAISEGTLLAAVAPEDAPRVREAWRGRGIDSYELGRFDGRLGASVVRREGKVGPLPEPTRDPFWDLFFAGLGA
jgi:hydrogenase expression/formation protein HypE